MRRLLPFLVCALVCALAFATLAPHARAYYVESRASGVVARYADQDTSDPDIDVEFRISTQGLMPNEADALTAIRAAFQTWTDASCGAITFNEGTNPTATVGADRTHWTADGGCGGSGPIYILVYFDDGTINPDEWVGGPSVGKFYFATTASGELCGGTVVLNSSDHSWSTSGGATELDVQGIATALIGRVLGITSGVPDNATYPSYAPGDTSKRTLGTDDLEAIAYLYPDSGAAGCDTPMDPEMICDGSMIGTCPPTPTTMNDGGTADGSVGRDTGTPPTPDTGTTPGSDSGTGGADGGTGADAGSMSGDGGCGCRAAGHPSGARGLWLALAGLALLAARRRRRR